MAHFSKPSEKSTPEHHGYPYSIAQSSGPLCCSAVATESATERAPRAYGSADRRPIRSVSIVVRSRECQNVTLPPPHWNLPGMRPRAAQTGADPAGCHCAIASAYIALAALRKNLRWSPPFDCTAPSKRPPNWMRTHYGCAHCVRPENRPSDARHRHCRAIAADGRHSVLCGMRRLKGAGK